MIFHLKSLYKNLELIENIIFEKKRIEYRSKKNNSQCDGSNIDFYK